MPCGLDGDPSQPLPRDVGLIGAPVVFTGCQRFASCRNADDEDRPEHNHNRDAPETVLDSDCSTRHGAPPGAGIIPAITRQCYTGPGSSASPLPPHLEKKDRRRGRRIQRADRAVDGNARQGIAAREELGADAAPFVPDHDRRRIPEIAVRQ